jgi:lipopolysaccharide transport system permease protein
MAGLLWTLVRTDFKIRYHGTMAGFVWALLKPIAMFVVLMSVFSFIFAASPDYKLRLVLGLFLWDFFAEATKVGLLSLQAKGYLLAKTVFPRWILVVSSASNPMVTLLAFSTAFLVALTAAGRLPSARGVGLYLVYMLALLLIVEGFALATSVLFLRYRDLNQVWEVLTQAGFFVAPVIYPLDIMPERFHGYLYLWPPTAIIQFSRMVLLEGAVPSARAHALLAVLALLSFLTGVLVFRRLAPGAAEHL